MRRSAWRSPTRGAELSRVWDKENHCQRLWSADPAVWNRHAPILFPFVGKVVNGKYRFAGREYETKTQHGFARDLDFACLEEDGRCLTQSLSASAADPGLAIYGVLAITSTLGLAWVGKKKH